MNLHHFKSKSLFDKEMLRMLYYTYTFYLCQSIETAIKYIFPITKSPV